MPERKNIIGIVAIAKDKTISINGKIPWDYPEDQKRFKKITTDSPVIMGRKTFSNIAEHIGALPNRRNIVLTQNPEKLNKFDFKYQNITKMTPLSREDVSETIVLFARSIEDIVDSLDKFVSEDIYVAGGLSIYEQFYHKKLIDRFDVTVVPEQYPDADQEDVLKFFNYYDNWTPKNTTTTSENLTIETYEFY